jgi:tetratricopeptide (TPR) repeat protein
MRHIRIIPALLLSTVFLLNTDCATTESGSDGWIVINGPADTQPPPKQQTLSPRKATGLEVAARYHVRSAYRFLQKDKPDHAIKELEKARAKMDQDYWFHYYMGGAFYMKAMYREARESWEMAYRYTKDPQMRSRIRTCQSFVVYRINGKDQSLGLLRRAVDLDEKNESAKEFLNDIIMVSTDEQGEQAGLSVKMGKSPKEKGSKGPGKATKKRKMIQDKERFMGYFLIEMPMN